MITVTFSREDLEKMVTGGGAQEISAQEILEEIERYQEAVARELGGDFEVEVSSYVSATEIDGIPAYLSDFASLITEAEASVIETFW